MAVAFYEYAGSPKFTGTGKEFTATRVGEIPWASMDAFYSELFPSAATPAFLPGSSVLRAQKVSYEPIFDEASIISTTAGVLPSPIASPTNVYTLAKATIEYANIPYEETSEHYPIRRRWNVGGQLLTIPNKGLAWADVTPVVAIDNPEMRGHLFVGTIRHEVTISNVDVVPWAAIRGLVGKVNDDTFEDAADECLLFSGVDISDNTSPQGDVVYTLGYHFDERNIDGDDTKTWNHLWDPGQGKWRPVGREGGGNLYTSGDFDDLLPTRPAP
jgi:hypothetical protein